MPLSAAFLKLQNPTTPPATASRPDPQHTSRKLSAKACLTASAAAAVCTVLRFVGTGTWARRPLCLVMLWRADSGRSAACRKVPSAPRKWLSMTKVKTASAISPSARDTALLTPEAVPEYPSPTDPMTAEVSGATVTAMPRPMTSLNGSTLVQ
ncbi:hypothetical protein GCM10022631_39560 [Deinococcus rubellus]